MSAINLSQPPSLIFWTTLNPGNCSLVSVWELRPAMLPRSVRGAGQLQSRCPEDVTMFLLAGSWTLRARIGDHRRRPQRQVSCSDPAAAVLSTWLLLAVLVGKMAAMALSLATGFIGGNVLPMLFVGVGLWSSSTQPSQCSLCHRGGVQCCRDWSESRPRSVSSRSPPSPSIGPGNPGPGSGGCCGRQNLLTDAIVRLIRSSSHVPPIHA